MDNISHHLGSNLVLVWAIQMLGVHVMQDLVADIRIQLVKFETDRVPATEKKSTMNQDERNYSYQNNNY